MTERTDAHSAPSRVLTYLRLFRAPNVFTALADVSMGFLFVQQQPSPLPSFLCLAAASAMLYTAGMVLNDVYDVELDARERPSRPLPSGQISLGWAHWLGYQLLLVGVALGWLSGYVDGRDDVLLWRSGLIATCLAACIWLYDAVLKTTVCGPLFMGACRFLNVLLGMSLAASWTNEVWSLGFRSEQLVTAGGIGVYVAGICWYARSEATTSRRGPLLLGTGMILLGISIIAVLPWWAPDLPFRIHPVWIWPLVLSVLMFAVLRRCAAGILDPRPALVQAAVKQSILSLIVLDASICLLVCPWYGAVGVLALIIPAAVLGRWIAST